MDIFTITNKCSESFTFESLKSALINYKTKPIAFVFHPETLNLVRIEIQKNTSVGTTEQLMNSLQKYDGFEIFSSSKVKQGIAKIAYTREEIREICETGRTKAEAEQVINYFTDIA